MSDLLSPVSLRDEISVESRSEHNTIYVCKYNPNTQHVLDNKKIPDLHTAVTSGDAFSHKARNSEKKER